MRILQFMKDITEAFGDTNFWCYREVCRKLQQEQSKKLFRYSVQYHLPIPLPGEPTVRSVTSLVADYYSTTTDILRGRSLNHEIVLVRHITFYLCSYRVNATLAAIGEYFDERDHSTIINGRERINEVLSARDAGNKRIAKDVFNLEAMLPKKQPMKAFSGVYNFTNNPKTI